MTDWNDMERIWQYIYSKDQLQTFSEEVYIKAGHIFFLIVLRYFIKNYVYSIYEVL